MKIGLIDVDGHNFPNLALMKISAFHRNCGDSVEWVNYLDRYDKVYMSKVFTFSNEARVCIQADEVVRGGTGYKMYDNLFCDNVNPDYSLYPQYKEAYGFLTRGCIRKCSWCIVPKKEGAIKPYRDIEEVLQGRKSAILMDNNILASDYGLQQLEKIIRLKCKVDFNQGLDARLVTDEIAKLLSRVKWLKYIRFACDTSAAIEPVIRAIETLNEYGVKSYRMFIYCLVNSDLKEAENRVLSIDHAGAVPFAQPYIDFTPQFNVPDEQKHFARWVNHRATFKSCAWKDYKYNIQE